MQFSIWPDNERPWAEVLDLATYAEHVGLASFWYADHFMSQTEDDTPGTDPALECWSVLTAVGALVPRLRLVSMVSPVTIHHPVVLAKRAATIDHITGGRVVLGLGAGWQVNEHRAYGFELPPPGERVSRFAEAIEVVHRLLNDERTDFAGRHYTVTDAPFEPKPLQDRLPLLVGTGSPRMLGLTARWADEWNTWGDPDEVARRTALFTTACERGGRDPGTVHRSAQAMVFLTTDEATRRTMAARAPAGRSLVGGPSELVDQLGRYADLGVDEFAIPDFTLGRTAAARRETLEVLVTEVLPALR